ncbi:hypothetical protein F4560_002692 [Saccharothrix ecbatanensis]|uniref:Ricin B lectin domain-containing protein n=1 Tax=Saccharothrix ecbatanensis TaxID=1105145 RepID=A0A7W9HIH8_9PSEU|nr:RICIN domain-containing protein [Saccharothrix ecbatanensis]MBB5802924.1 hypothetical protein [Saccharothrix ecbatanensis]
MFGRINRDTIRAVRHRRRGSALVAVLALLAATLLQLVGATPAAALSGAWPKVGAGGADVYDDGAEKYLAYHYYDANANGLGKLDIRHISMANGWPVLSGPLDFRNNHLVNQNSDHCADVWFNSTADGGYFTLSDVNSRQCLEIGAFSTVSGTALTQYSCNGGANQQWLLV